MFKRIIDGLTSPTRTATHIYDKWYMPLLVILFMGVLYLIPSIYYSMNDDMLTYAMQKSIRNSFMSSEVVEYKIIDNEVVYNYDATDITYVDTEYGRVLFSNTNIEVKNLARNVNYLLSGNSIKVIYGGLVLYQLPIENYSGLNNLDFSLAKVDNSEFWNSVFGVLSNIIDSNKGKIITSTIFYNEVYIIMEILILALLITFVIKMQTRAKFGMIFKLAIYICMPAYLGILLATMYSMYLLSTIGLIWTFVYSYKISKILRTNGGI